MADGTDCFSSDLGTVPSAGFAGNPVLGGSGKPSEGPSEPYPNANDGYSPGDAMADAVDGIQHSGESPAGSDAQGATVGVVDRNLTSSGHVVGNPSASGTTIATTPNPNSVASGVAYTQDPGSQADPGSHDPAIPNPGSSSDLSSGVAVKVSDNTGS